MKYFLAIITFLLLLQTSCQTKKNEAPVSSSPDAESTNTSKIDTSNIEGISADTTYFDVADDTDDFSDEDNQPIDGWPKPTNFTTTQKTKLNDALIIANKTLKDPLFYKILQVMGDRKLVDWGSYRLGKLPPANRAKPERYIIDQFKKKGLNKLEEFQAYRWPTNSTTTGSAFCNKFPKVNVNKLNRPIESIAATMVHERMHVFCQRHESPQGYKKNKCDLAYQSGSLTKAIYAYRKNGSKPKPTKSKLCSDLKKVLIEYKVLKANS